MNKILLGVIIAIIVIGGGVYFLSKNNSSQQMQMSMPTQTQGQAPTGSTGSTQLTAGKNAVTIQNFAFSPATLTVKVGDKVTWTNQDSAGHSATADDGSFDTGVLPQGQSGSITFNKAGTYTYHCSVHPMMKGTIIVQ
ncbi:MAG TPA: cupredoxin family copper-binding protein [Candidatus Saccharimonadales bacterium]|nr:cupredoxin family copper-binding protein [Candidatus Saccharimonadales bacterium]